MKFKFCPECGCKFDKEFRFCPECGLNLADFGEIGKKEQKKDGASDLSSLESLFDKQIKKREDDDKVYQNRLMAAKILVIKEEYEKAENAYNEILFDVVDDAIPYIGLIRAISKNFTVLDEKNVNEQMELLFDLFDKDVCLKADADFKSFYEERELHFLELKEQEEARQEEIKRKEIQAERIRKLNEENARKAREREEKARKEANDAKTKFLKDYQLAQKKAKTALGLERVNNKIYFGVNPEGEKIEWDIINETDDVICMIVSNVFQRTSYYKMHTVWDGDMEGVDNELNSFRALFNNKQKAILANYEFTDDNETARTESIRLLNTYEFFKWRQNIPKDYYPYWVKRLYYLTQRQYHWKTEEKLTLFPFLYVSNGSLEFEGKTTIACWLRPMTIIDKKKLIYLMQDK